MVSYVWHLPMQRKTSLLFLCCLLIMVQFCWGVGRQYSLGRIIEVQQKSRDKVDMYLVNTPVTTAVPYFEMTVRVGDTGYLAEYSPRHSGEELPSDWATGADVGVRVEK